jgi:hypothetical protein
MRNPKENKSKKKIPCGGAAARAYQFALQRGEAKPEPEAAGETKEPPANEKPDSRK